MSEAKPKYASGMYGYPVQTFPVLSEPDSYEFVHAYPTLVETVQRYIPEAADMSDERCLALIEEAKAESPKDLRDAGSRTKRAKWIWKYIAAKAGRK